MTAGQARSHPSRRDFFEPTWRGYARHAIASVLLVSVLTTTSVVFGRSMSAPGVVFLLTLFFVGDAVACFVPFVRAWLNAAFR